MSTLPYKACQWIGFILLAISLVSVLMLPSEPVSQGGLGMKVVLWVGTVSLVLGLPCVVVGYCLQYLNRKNHNRPQDRKDSG